MKPANFPARKDARRERAIERLVADSPLFKLSREDRRRLADLVALKLNRAARDVRTKKPRGLGR